jgi:Leucine-rich repeat (LRR) protein
MKQVAEVAYASQNCVDLYVHSLGTGTREAEQGLLGYIRMLPRFVWTLPTRYRIAAEIRDLKIRSREVGERRLRYGVEAPPRRGNGRSKVPYLVAQNNDTKVQEDARRLALAEAEPAPFPGFTLTKWMGAADGGKPKKQGTPRVIALVGTNGEGRTLMARTLFQDLWAARSSSSSGCMAWISLGEKDQYHTSRSELLRDILTKLAVQADNQLSGIEEWQDEQLLEELQRHLEGKEFLVVLDDLRHESPWDNIKSALFNTNCSPGSAILVTTGLLMDVAVFLCPDEIYNVSNIGSNTQYYYLTMAMGLLVMGNHQTNDLRPLLRAIFTKLALETPNCKLLLHALYVNPHRTKEDLQRLLDSLNDSSSNNKTQVLMFRYYGLSSSCRKCLLYLVIFPKETTLRRAKLVRRWAAEGMVTKTGRQSALDEAESCFDILVTHRFIIPKDTDDTDKVRSCTMDASTHDLFTKIAAEQNFVETNLPPDLAHRLSVRTAFQLQQAAQQLHRAHSNVCWSICSHLKTNKQPKIGEPNVATKIFLESLPLSTQLVFLEVLDLEGCKELKNHHLKNICNHVFQLKYLSLQNTDITELPKQLDKLRHLETLDIRQTKVQAFAKNSVILPRLKHLFAGNKKDCKNQNTIPEEQFFTVKIPKSIGAMTELQVLSDVAVSGSSDEMIGIANLIQLRKLGVVLQDPQDQVFRHLYHAIGKVSRSLRALSIWIIAHNKNAGVDMEQTVVIPPIYLQTLEISGLISGFPAWVANLRELTKLTLHKTHFTADDIKILGSLSTLCYLRLWKDSCSENLKTLTFSEGKFINLQFLIIECSNMTAISFGGKATPKLKKIVWSSTGSQSLTGIELLPSLKLLKLTGHFDLERVKQAIAANRNGPILETNSNDALSETFFLLLNLTACLNAHFGRKSS